MEKSAMKLLAYSFCADVDGRECSELRALLTFTHYTPQRLSACSVTLCGLLLHFHFAVT